MDLCTGRKAFCESPTAVVLLYRSTFGTGSHVQYNPKKFLRLKMAFLPPTTTHRPPLFPETRNSQRRDAIVQCRTNIWALSLCRYLMKPTRAIQIVNLLITKVRF